MTNSGIRFGPRVEAIQFVRGEMWSAIQIDWDNEWHNRVEIEGPPDREKAADALLKLSVILRNPRNCGVKE